MREVPTKRRRILTLDLLRGLFLVVIFVDHLAYAPSLFLQFATGTSGAFASAAEGFFAISGILVGYIYGPRILKNTKATTIKLWKRALLLYGLTVGFTLFYSVWSALLPEPYPRQVGWVGDGVGLLVQALTLQFHFGWADFLARYAVFMVIAPLAVWLIATRRAWVVAGVSAAIWLLWRESPGIQPFTAWQLIFMFGIILGFYLPAIEQKVASWRLSLRQILWWLVVSIATISYCYVVIRWSILPFLSPSVADTLPTSWLLDRESVGPGRVLIGVVWFAGLYLLFRRFEGLIQRYTYGALLLLGQNSLFVYSFEAFLIFLIDVTFPAAHSPLWINTLVGIAGVSIVYLATRYRHILKVWGYNRSNEIT